MSGSKQHCDLIVIGGGPAGMMAAGQAASMGVKTLLLEKMEAAGKKLRITGQGRCNLTNSAGIRDFTRHFGPNGKFLKQAFYRFFNGDLVRFFGQLGVKTEVERGGRIFPGSGGAEDVTRALEKWVEAQGAEVRLSAAAAEILAENGQVAGVRLRDGEEIPCRAAILAAGGASYPGTGSSGDGFRMAEAAGHTIAPVRPALVPMKTRGDTAQRLQGLTLKNIHASVFFDGEKVEEAFGEMLFTHFGISGPIILTMSGMLVDALRVGKKITLSIDLKPALDEARLDDRLLRELDAHGKMHFQNILKSFLPVSLIPVCVEQTGIPSHKPGHQINAEERARLLAWLKDFRLEVTGHLPLSAAMVTQGGVSLDEVDPRSMASRLVRGLYFAGEVLDLAADTGGYNLQAAFSTGWLAGRAAEESLL